MRLLGAKSIEGIEVGSADRSSDAILRRISVGASECTSLAVTAGATRDVDDQEDADKQ